MRYFISTGEASGELAGVVLARAVRALDPEASFEGIGGARMRDEGFVLWRDHRGWATFGPFEAFPRIPKMMREMHAAAARVKDADPDCLVLVDFGAFNVRLAYAARRAGYRGPIVDLFPPAAWLDRPAAARAVTVVAHAVTAFEHQRDFYVSLGLPVRYFGHPLVSQYRLRELPPAPPPDGGTIAFLPGSRASEIRRHVPLLARALARLRLTRPNLAVLAGSAPGGARALARAMRRSGLNGVPIVEGAAQAAGSADAAFVASGTAVLECALLGVPPVAFYTLSPLLAFYGRFVYRGPFFTIPNLVMHREIVPEFLHKRATPHSLAGAMETVLKDPGAAYRELLELRAALGPSDSLERIARFVVETASARAC